MNFCKCLLADALGCKVAEPEQCAVFWNSPAPCWRGEHRMPTSCPLLAKGLFSLKQLHLHSAASGNKYSIDALRILAGVAAAPITTSHFEEGLEWLLKFLCRMLGAENGEIFLVEPTGVELLLCASVGPDQVALWERYRFRVGCGFPGTAYAEQRIKSSRSIDRDPNFLRKSLIKSGIQTFMSVPIRGASGKAVGCLGFAWRRKDLNLESIEKALWLAAYPLANAIDTTFLGFRQQIASEFSSLNAYSIADCLPITLSTLIRTSGADCGQAAVWDSALGKMTHHTSSGSDLPSCLFVHTSDTRSMPACSALSNSSLKKGDPRIFSCSKVHFDGVAACCIPIVNDDSRKGVAVLGFRESRPLWSARASVPLLLAARAARNKLARASGRETNKNSISAIRLEIRCFGRFEVKIAGKVVPASAFARRHALQLLKILVIRAERPVHRDQLIDLLWPKEENEFVRLNRLYGVIHSLRKAIETSPRKNQCKTIVSDGESYFFHYEPDCVVDLLRFKKLLACAEKAQRQDESQICAQYLAEAVELYCGDLFEEDLYEEWCQSERLELKESYIKALTQLGRYYVEHGDSEHGIECFQRAIKCDPYREDLHASLISFFARIGRNREALGHYQKCLRVFLDEFGEPPGPTLQHAYRLVPPLSGAVK